MPTKSLLLNVTFAEQPKFQELFDEVGIIQRPSFTSHYNNVIVLWGGEDINSWIYREKHWQTGLEHPMSRRDAREFNIVFDAKAKGIPIIAVCRGAQLMTAIAGGKLIQHVYHHAGQHHEIKTDDGRVMLANSYHHQMCYLEGGANGDGRVDHELIAWSHPNRSSIYYGSEGTYSPELPATRELGWREPEVFWLPAWKALCIQGHPEYRSDGVAEYEDYCCELVKKYILCA